MAIVRETDQTFQKTTPSNCLGTLLATRPSVDFRSQSQPQIGRRGISCEKKTQIAAASSCKNHIESEIPR